jgi:hypothetical protein
VILFNKNIGRRASSFKDSADALLAIYTRFSNRETDDVRKKDIERAFRDLESTLIDVRRLIRELATTQDFFTVTHLSRVATWATHHGYELGGMYRAEKRALVFIQAGGDQDEETIRLPAGFTLPTGDLIHKFERSISASLRVVS